MKTQVNVTHTGNRLKVTAQVVESSLRISRHELLYPSASQDEIRAAVRRQRLAAARTAEAVRQEVECE